MTNKRNKNNYFLFKNCYLFESRSEWFSPDNGNNHESNYEIER